MSCAEQIFTGVTQESFNCLAAKAQAAGIPINGNSGQASQSGVTVSWSFDPGSQRLSIHVLRLPLLVPCGIANSKIHDFVEDCIAPKPSSFDLQAQQTQPQTQGEQEISMTQAQESIITDQAFLTALAPFQQPGGVPQAQAADLCGTYQKVKPILQGILPLLKAIPVIGTKAAQAISVLIGALDILCPIGGGTAAPAQAALAGPDQDFLAALDAFQPGAVSAQAFDLCGTYKKVKPILKGVAPFIKLIPVVGAPAGAAIELLITALDTFCPGS